jgi:putative serine protease PepD
MTAQRRPLLLTLASAVLGAGALAAILFATGAVHGSTTRATGQPVTAGLTVANQSLHPVTLYANSAPGVVDIIARGTTTVQSPLGPSSEQATSTGAGIVLDRQGHILTADHVVGGASSVSVKFANGATRPVRIVGRDRPRRAQRQPVRPVASPGRAGRFSRATGRRSHRRDRRSLRLPAQP